MSFELTRSVSLTASAAIAQYRFVIMAANAQIAQSTAGADAVGVSAEAATAAGDVINVFELAGKAEVEAGAAITISGGAAPVSSDANGRAIASTTGNPVLGYALQAASAAGERVTVLLLPRAADA